MFKIKFINWKLCYKGESPRTLKKKNLKQHAKSVYNGENKRAQALNGIDQKHSFVFDNISIHRKKEKIILIERQRRIVTL